MGVTKLSAALRIPLGLGLVGFALNWLLAAAERRLLAWRDRTVAKY